MRPLISYYGGKQRMASKIVPLIPPHTVYCEPFAGGAAVFYKKPKLDPSNGGNYCEILNDLNGDLVNMYQAARNNPSHFNDLIQGTPFAAAIYKSSRLSFTNSVHRALAFYINTQQSFANKFSGGWQRSTLDRNHAKAWVASQKVFLESANRLQGVYLDSIDAVACIEKWDSPQTFFYIDPPYLGTSLGSMGQWSRDDLKRLNEALNITKASFIISGYCMKGMHIRNAKSIAFKADCSATGAGKVGAQRNHGDCVNTHGREREEVIWMRGPAAPIRKSLIPILQKQTCFTGPLLGPCPLPLYRKAS